MSSYRLRLLGLPAIVGDEGVVGGRVSQRHRLALLALLAIATDHTLSRDTLVALLWPDSSTRRARHLLSVAIHEIRKTLGENALVSQGGNLRLDPAVIEPDVRELRDALEREDPKTVVEVYSGPFLDGFHLTENLEFDQWAEETRAELAGHYEKALEKLAVEAESRNDSVAAARWWSDLARVQPFSGWIVVRAMQAMAAAGDRGRALQCAQEHEALMQRELGTGADPEVSELTERLRAEASERGALRPPSQTSEGTYPSTRTLYPAAEISGLLEPSTTSRSKRWIRNIALASVSLAALFLSGGTGVPEKLTVLQRDLVQVLSIQNESGDPRLDPVGDLARDEVLRGLGEIGVVRVATDDQSHEAGLVVIGAFHREGGRLVFRARVDDVESGEMLRTIVGIPVDHTAPGEGVEVFGRRVAGALATAVDPRLSSWAHAASQPPSPAAYRELVRGIDEFARFNMPEAIAAFDRAAAEDPAFTVPRLWVAYSYHKQWGRAYEDSITASLAASRERMPPWDRAMLEYFLARSRGDLSGALVAMRRVVEIVPHSPEWRDLLAKAALDVNRPREAAEAFTGIDLQGEALSGNYMTDVNALHLLGECDREYEIARRAHARDPHNYFKATGRSGVLICKGRIQEAMSIIEEEMKALPSTTDGRWNRATALAGIAMEMRAHGHPREARQVFERAFAVFDSFPSLKETNPFVYGMLLYEAGRWAAAGEAFARVSPYTGLGPVNVNLLGYEGLIAARLGHEEQARAIASRITALPDQMEAAGGRRGYYATNGAIYRARIAAVLGEREDAVTILRELLVGGMPWRYIMLDVHNTIDYLDLRGYPLFDELVRPKG
ncbi:MAG TPA: BTAD domain-containing putative transcriptional regulator [Gemmatimonadota bacterium]|nr:BTAD domain-containing putative transcriptional regulator [Gemmatimonadota bacterium]